jgi:tape measure domain-containing protein
MAKQDVELVIRARNAASGALKEVTAALKELRGVQADVTDTSKAADTTLGKFAETLTKLTATAKGLDALGKVAAQADKLNVALGRMDADAAKAQAELAKLSAEAETAATASATLAADAAKANAALTAQKETVKALRTEQVANNAAVREADSGLKALANDVSKLKAPNVALVVEYRQQRELYAELVARQGELTARRTVETEALARLGVEAKAANIAAREAAVANTAAADSAAAAASRVERLNATLEKSKAEYAAITTELKAATEGLGLATADTEHLAAAQTRLAGVITQTTEALKRQKAVGPVAGPSGPGFTGLAGPGGTVGPAAQATADFRNQAAAAQGAALAYTAAQEKLTALHAAMAGIIAPTAEQTATILLQRQAVDAAEAAWVKESATLKEMRDEIRATKAARDSLTAATEQAARAEIEADNQRIAALIRANQARREAIESEGLFGRSIRTVSEALAAQNREVGFANSNFSRTLGHLTSMIAVYGGLYAAVHQFSEVIKTTTDTEAAQIRITTALNQGTEAGVAAFNHAAEAARALKLDILPTVDSYGLFLASLHGTTIEGPKAVQIFDDLLVTIRAFKLGPDAMQRAILALKDMAARGNIARREINQLDQALPVGLLNELAKAAGYAGKEGLAQFSKEVHGGKVGLDLLLPALDAVAARAKTNLPAALNTAQSSFADFRNAIYDARLAVGQSGLLDSVNIAAQKLAATLRSPDGINGLKALGNALAGAVDFMTLFVTNANVMIGVIGALGGVKLVSLIASFGTLSTVLRAIITVVFSVTASFEAMTAAMAAAGGVQAALGGILTALTGPVGIAVAVASIAAGFLLWATHTTDAQAALTDYEVLMRHVADLQAEAAKSGKDLTDALKNASIFEAEKAFRSLSVTVENIKAEFTGLGGSLNVLKDAAEGAGNQALLQEVNHLESLATAYKTGVLNAHDFAIALASANKEFKNEEVKKLAADYAEWATRLADTSGKLGDVAQIAIHAGSTMDGLADAAKNNTGALDAMKQKLSETHQELDEGETAFEKYTKAIDVLKQKVPALAAEMKKLGEAAKIDADLAQAIKAANELPEGLGQRNALNAALDTAGQARASLDAGKLTAALQQLQTVTEKAAKAIVNFEGGNQTIAFWDTNHWRVGFSSDTKTGPGGEVSTVKQGDTSTLAEAVRDLTRRIGIIMSDLEKELGADRFRALTDEQKAVLASLEYNFGKLPESVANAIRTGQSTANIAQLIRSLQPQNGTRRATEAAVFESTGESTDRQALTIIKETEKETEKLKKNEDDVNKSLQERIDLLNAEAAGKEISNKQGFIDKTVQQEINAAKQKGITLTKEQIEQLKKAAAANYDAKHKDEEAKDKRAEVQKLVDQINGLNQQLITAQKELALAVSEGAGERADEARKKIAELTQQIKDAIPHARELVNALHDETMTATLDKANLAIEKVHLSTERLAISINEALVNGLTNAFSAFFQAIAAGEKPLKALGAAVRKFFVDFLNLIAQAILKQLLFNLITAGGGAAGGLGGIFGSLLGSIGVTALHKGGIVGQPSGMIRRVSPELWRGAIQRYHDGGIVGLRPNEVPIIAKKNEEMITEADPRHRDNGGLAPSVDLKVVNAFDGTSFLSSALTSTPGQRVLLNYFQDNASGVKAALGIT